MAQITFTGTTDQWVRSFKLREDAPRFAVYSVNRFITDNPHCQFYVQIQDDAGNTYTSIAAYRRSHYAAG